MAGAGAEAEAGEVTGEGEGMGARLAAAGRTAISQQGETAGAKPAGTAGGAPRKGGPPGAGAGDQNFTPAEKTRRDGRPRLRTEGISSSPVKFFQASEVFHWAPRALKS